MTTPLFLVAITFAGLGQPVLSCIFAIAAIAVSQRRRISL